MEWLDCQCFFTQPQRLFAVNVAVLCLNVSCMSQQVASQQHVVSEWKHSLSSSVMCNLLVRLLLFYVDAIEQAYRRVIQSEAFPLADEHTVVFVIPFPQPSISAFFRDSLNSED